MKTNCAKGDHNFPEDGVCVDCGAVRPGAVVSNAFPSHAAAVEIDWGVGGCHTVSARNAGGAQIFSATFPGRGRESLDAAVSCARLMAEGSGGADIIGPAGLVEAVKHPGGVAGVLGLDALPAGSAVLPYDLLYSVVNVVTLASDGELDVETASRVWSKVEPLWNAAQASRNRGVPLGFSDPVAIMGAAAHASNEIVRAKRGPAVSWEDVLKLLGDCLGFVEGFEDDETQGDGDENCVPGLLERLRAVVSPSAVLPADSQCMWDRCGVLVVVVNESGGIVSADIEWAEHPGDRGELPESWRRVVVPMRVALASVETRDAAEHLRKELRGAGLKLNVRKHFSLLNAEACLGKAILKGGAVA